MKKEIKMNKEEKESKLASNALSEPYTVEVAATTNDFKTAILIVSIAVNLVILTAWIIMQITTKYDGQIYSFLFTRY
jgi:hypothetical protein